MNLPNKLTIARLFMAMLFVAALATELPHSRTVALALFIIASITDWLDGSIARSRGQVTTFGKLMDPLADKVLMGAAFVMLAGRDLFPHWAVVVIMTREFLVTGMRLVASSSDGAVLAADSLGKQKTIFQVVTSIYLLVIHASTEPALGFLRPLLDWNPDLPRLIGVALVGITLALTVISGVSYLVKNRSILRDA
jgi:CDP-diacylglycerol--glycerol-3-phosphate 3-phosphatidyltransferase